MTAFTYPEGKANERRSYLKLQRYIHKTEKLNAAPIWYRKSNKS
jgi:hypothetical protein